MFDGLTGAVDRRISQVQGPEFANRTLAQCTPLVMRPQRLIRQEGLDLDDKTGMREQPKPSAWKNNPVALFISRSKRPGIKIQKELMNAGVS